MTWENSATNTYILNLKLFCKVEFALLYEDKLTLTDQMTTIGATYLYKYEPILKGGVMFGNIIQSCDYFCQLLIYKMRSMLSLFTERHFLDSWRDESMGSVNISIFLTVAEI